MSSDTLVLVHSVIRHGEKTPEVLSLYPTDPYTSENYFPYGYGMLTNEGKQTMYITGKAFRERYDKFVGDLYFPGMIETWSSMYECCRTSAGLLLAGFFPPKGPQKWSEDLEWLPIPINYTSDTENDLLATVLKSRRFLDAYNKIFETSYGKDVLKQYADTIAYVEKHSGWKINDTRKLSLLRDIFLTQERLGLELPEWSKLIHPEKLIEITHIEFEIEAHTKELRRLILGPLLKKILSDTLDKINGKSEHKVHLYVGHDVNIANLLTIMGVMDKHLPHFAAALAWELHKVNGRYGFKMFYKRDRHQDFEPLALRNGETIWWIDDFEKFVNDLWTDDDLSVK